MRIKQLSLDDDGTPEKITAEFTQAEAVFMTLLLGKQNGLTSEEIMAGGSAISSELYEALTGELFNRYYEDGVSGALRQ